MPAVRKSDIDQLVLGYVAEERYIQTRNKLFDESPNLPEKVPILSIFGDISSENRLQTVLEEYVQFKTRQLIPICAICEKCESLTDLWKMLDKILHEIRYFKPPESSPIADQRQELQRYSPVQMWQSLRSKSGKGDSSQHSATLQRKRLNPVSHVYETVAIESRELSGSAKRKRSKVTRRVTSPVESQIAESCVIGGELSTLLHTSDRNDALALVGMKILSNMKKCAEKSGGENETSVTHRENVPLSPLKQSCGPVLDIEDLISDETRGGLVEMTIDSLLNTDPAPAANDGAPSSTFSEDFSELRKLLEFDDTDSSCIMLPEVVQSRQDERDLIDIIKADDDFDLPGNPSSATVYQTSSSSTPCMQSEDEKTAVAGLLAIQSTLATTSLEKNFDSEMPTILNIRSEGSSAKLSTSRGHDCRSSPLLTNAQQISTADDSKDASVSNSQCATASNSDNATASNPQYASASNSQRTTTASNLQHATASDSQHATVYNSQTAVVPGEHSTKLSSVCTIAATTMPERVTVCDISSAVAVASALSDCPNSTAAAAPDADSNHGTCTSTMPPKKRFLVQESRTPEKGHSLNSLLTTPMKKKLEVAVSGLMVYATVPDVSTATTVSSDIMSEAVSLADLGLRQTATGVPPDGTDVSPDGTEQDQWYSVNHDPNSVTNEMQNLRRSRRQRRPAPLAQGNAATLPKFYKRKPATPRKSKTTKFRLSDSPNVKVMTPGQGSVVLNLKDRMPMHVPGIVVHPKKTGAEMSKDEIISQLVCQMQETNFDLVQTPNVAAQPVSHNSKSTTESTPPQSPSPLLTVPDQKLSDKLADNVMANSISIEEIVSAQEHLQSKEGINLAEKDAIRFVPSLSKDLEGQEMLNERDPPELICLGAGETLLQETDSPIASAMSIQSPQLLIDESFNDCVSTQSDLNLNPGASTVSSLCGHQEAAAPQNHLMYNGSSLGFLATPEKFKTTECFSTISPSAGIFSVIGERHAPRPSPKKKLAKTNLAAAFLEESRNSNLQNNNPQIVGPRHPRGRIHPSARRARRAAHFSDRTRNSFERPRKAPGKRNLMKRRGASGLFMCNKMKNMVRIEPKRQGMPAVRRYIVQANQGCTDGEPSSTRGKASQDGTHKRDSLPKSKTTRSGRRFGNQVGNGQTEKQLMGADAPDQPSGVVTDAASSNATVLQIVDKKARNSLPDCAPIKNKRKNASKPLEGRKKKCASLADRRTIMNWSYEEIQARLDAIHGKRNSSGAENHASVSEVEKLALPLTKNRGLKPQADKPAFSCTKDPAFSLTEYHVDASLAERRTLSVTKNHEIALGSGLQESPVFSTNNHPSEPTAEKYAFSTIKNRELTSSSEAEKLTFPLTKNRELSHAESSTNDSRADESTFFLTKNLGLSLTEHHVDVSLTKRHASSVAENHELNRSPEFSLTENHSGDSGAEKIAVSTKRHTDGPRTEMIKKTGLPDRSSTVVRHSRRLSRASEHNVTLAMKNPDGNKSCRIRSPENNGSEWVEPAPQLSHASDQDNVELYNSVSPLPAHSFNLEQLEPLDLSLSSWAHYSKSPFKVLHAFSALSQDKDKEATDPVAQGPHGESKNPKRRKRKSKKLFKPHLKKMDISKFLDSLDYSDPRIARS